jgi:hypothetical protein
MKQIIQTDVNENLCHDEDSLNLYSKSCVVLKKFKFLSIALKVRSLQLHKISPVDSTRKYSGFTLHIYFWFTVRWSESLSVMSLLKLWVIFWEFHRAMLSLPNMMRK